MQSTLKILMMNFQERSIAMLVELWAWAALLHNRTGKRFEVLRSIPLWKATSLFKTALGRVTGFLPRLFPNCTLMRLVMLLDSGIHVVTRKAVGLAFLALYLTTPLCGQICMAMAVDLKFIRMTLLRCSICTVPLPLVSAPQLQIHAAVKRVVR